MYDKVTILARSGNGGRGCISFRREKYIPFGGPNGGNGGKGGDVYLMGTPGLNNFYDFKFKKHFFAKNGMPGEGCDRYGKHGEDLYIKLPFGTVCTIKNKVIDILDETPIKILQGGKGGIGNSKLATSTNKAPRFFIPHGEGEEVEISMQLKLIGDIGLIGLPNAGKSSLISKITKCNSKIGDYAFTTLDPVVGVYNKIIFVDLPGIIEGASEDRGLGFKFLSHMERCKVYFQIIDCTDDIEKSYLTVQKEVEAYGIKKFHVVVLNKIENIEKDKLEEISLMLKKKYDIAVLCISIHHNINVDKLLLIAERLIEKY